jgi:hypothetical protein
MGYRRTVRARVRTVLATVRGMETPTLLQTGPETFRVLLGDGRERTVTLPHHTRRGLGLHGVPPLTVAREIVRFLLERGDDLPDQASLGAVAGRHVGFVDELRGRLT